MDEDGAECLRCSQDPNFCGDSNIVQEVRKLSQVLAKHGLYYDTRGMTCEEDLRMMNKEINNLKTQNRYTVFTTGKSFEIRARDIEEARLRAACSQIVSLNNLRIKNVMLHFSHMESYIDISKAHKNVIHIEGFKRQERTVCPECLTHKQGSSSTFHDCKTVFTKNGETVGQCQCYSEEHGTRRD